MEEHCSPKHPNDSRPTGKVEKYGGNLKAIRRTMRQSITAYEPLPFDAVEISMVGLMRRGKLYFMHVLGKSEVEPLIRGSASLPAVSACNLKRLCSCYIEEENPSTKCERREREINLGEIGF